MFTSFIPPASTIICSTSAKALGRPDGSVGERSRFTETVCVGGRGPCELLTRAADEDVQRRAQCLPTPSIS